MPLAGKIPPDDKSRRITLAFWLSSVGFSHDRTTSIFAHRHFQYNSKVAKEIESHPQVDSVESAGVTGMIDCVGIPRAPSIDQNFCRKLRNRRRGAATTNPSDVGRVTNVQHLRRQPPLQVDTNTDRSITHCEGNSCSFLMLSKFVPCFRGA